MTSKEVKLLLSTSKALINKLTSFELYLNSLQIDCLNDNDLVEYQLRFNDFKTLDQSYNDVTIKLDALEINPSEFRCYNDFNTRFIKLCTQATILQNKSIQLNQTNVNAESPTFNHTANAKLPKIQIPNFDGNLCDFTAFYETFVSLVHNNNNIPNIEKFHYLSGSLTGNAKRLISNISPSGENYKVAFDLLCERFNNPKLLIQKHVKNIFDLKPVVKENASEFRSLYDELTKNVRALQNLNIDVEGSAVFLSHILMDKFDPNTRRKFGELKPNAILTFKEMNAFLKQRCLLLEEIEINQSFASPGYSLKTPTNNQGVQRFKPPKARQTFVMTSNKTPHCPLCGSNHYLNHCQKLYDMTVKQRFEKISDLKLRVPNVIKTQHPTSFRKGKNLSAGSSNIEAEVFENSLTSSEGTSSTIPNQTSLSCVQLDTQVLLATAVVRAKGKYKWFNARCLLDSASQQSFITESFVDKLQLSKKTFYSTVMGINSSCSQVNSIATVEIKSCHSKYKTNLQCLVIPKITETLPNVSFERRLINIPSNIVLADDSFNTPGAIDILIGASLFYDLLLKGYISLGKKKPILKETTLGWIVSGNFSFVNCFHTQSVTNTHLSLYEPSLICSEPVEQIIYKFWQIEEVTPKNKLSLLSPSERFCEMYFSKTVRTDASGRFVVSIPFNSKLFQLGNSKQTALNRFLSLERRLQKDSCLRHEYKHFMHEYLRLGHMSKVFSSSDITSFFANSSITTLNTDGFTSQIPPYYLPHHAVVKTSSLTTKVRVVFDASSKTDTGVSLNDTQITGPVVQDDLFSILLRFRRHQIALIGDIEQAYRQILIEPFLRKFHLVLWRDNPSAPIDTYCLNTVTYGTVSASYLTTKCLQYLADLNANQFPRASNILKTSFYMDDLLTGGDTVQEVIQIRSQLIEILGKAGFPIRKFLSNNSELLSSSSHSNSFFTVPVGERENCKTLGVAWNSVSDDFQYKYRLKERSQKYTKRNLLSVIAQIYDPLGLLQPIIVKSKLIIQKLWQLKLGWDDLIPVDLSDEWSKFLSSLCVLNSFKIPRCIILRDSISMELIGFSDASSIAYGACIYLRCTCPANTFSIQLVCSKSRVAPLHGVTIPRLELCAAVLLAELMKKVIDALSINFKQILYFTDSTIVLHWICAVPNKYKIFVANRIAVLQELSNSKDWHYIESGHNPADLVSRGSLPQTLLQNELWFHGPSFLAKPQSCWPKRKNHSVTVPDELKGFVQKKVYFSTSSFCEIFSKFSSLTRLQRIVAWILRFTSNSRKHNNSMRLTGTLTVSELQESLTFLIKLCQTTAFCKELQLLKQGKQIKSSNIKCLNPFLDKREIIRVGGRLSRSTFSYDKKFPILLPKGHVFTKLVLKHFHQKMLHCGPQQLLACTREEFWPISGRNMSKEIYHKCVTCFRAKPHSFNPFMSDLPSERLQCYNSAFTNVGVDYAGPILIKDRKLRGSKMVKAYICLFVCMVTRAIHLELVTELTTDSFFSAFRRFIGRRGKPSCMMSDNATNFVGASRQLRELYSFLESSVVQDAMSNFLTSQGIVWKFIVPNSPHMGGIWESSIKSTKLHLSKVLGNTQTTYEDFQTILVQVEAVLNSRPLSPLSTDPSDLSPLTCGHFLIGRPLVALPEPNTVPVNENRLRHYERLQKIAKDFWKRWSVEVVPELQRRIKWFTRLPELLKVGVVVIIKEDNLPPLQWCMGRVVEIHRSADGITRAATIQLSNKNTIKRAVHKLCVLPSVEI